ncbi:hypothetical protein KAI12_01735, partial [Candidatus Bathyarchaeota archaeon]|nr:hypothetical protein [Candidatus Bathyarchaeota archaeon]
RISAGKMYITIAPCRQKEKNIFGERIDLKLSKINLNRSCATSRMSHEAKITKSTDGDCAESPTIE